MVWDYRMVKRKINGDAIFGIHEVYYNSDLPEFQTDKDKTISGLTEEACSPFGESLEELKENIKQFTQALEQPILNYDRSFVSETGNDSSSNSNTS
jgi:hypothetical protein